MLKQLLSRATLALLVAIPAASAQIGDRQDKKGEVQKSLVPPEKIPPAPALTPEQALKSFKLAPGIKLELAAAEPLVQEPVAITFGPDGRMWVVEMRGYMPDLDGNGEDAPVGRVVVLSDRDGDGRYDDSKVFADQLVLPRAIALVGDGVLVGAPPELMFLRDTDGDGKADKKDIVAADYGVRVDPKRPHLANPERAPNSLLWAFDNWIYSAAYTKKFRYTNGAWETGGSMFRGQWGLTQDDFGRFYYGSNSDSLRVDVIFSDYLQRNPHYPRLAGTNVNGAEDQFVWPARVNPGINRGYRPEMLREGKLKEFTAACGWWVYRGDLMPKLTGNLFVAEPSGNFVRRTLLTSENGTVRGRNAYAEQQQEFIASTDERFRPVSFATGPDGALYVVDLYRGVLQHRISLTSYLRKQSEDRNLADPQHLGRIYRVVPADSNTRRTRPTEPRTTVAWVERLAHPNSYWREAAQRTLVARRDATVTPAIRDVAVKSPEPLARVQALWTLDGIGALDRDVVLSALGHGSPVVRVAGARLSDRFINGSDRDEVIKRLLVLVKDTSPEVQLQAVLTLGAAADPKIDLTLAETARMYSKNTFLRDALFSGLANRELALLEQLNAKSSWNDEDADKILSGLARGVFGSRQLPAIERVISLAAKAAASGAAKRAVALVEGWVPTPGASRRPLQFARQPEGWAELENLPAAKTRLARLKDVVVWPGKPGVAAIAAVKPLTAEQQGRFETGKGLFSAVCAACHQVTGRGLDGLAPPLVDSEWVLDTVERPVRIVLHGVRGSIRVLGKTHTGDMPAFGGALDDQQISSILTYIRREWGHTASPIDPAQVKAIRAATAGHTDAWSPEELMQVK